MITRRQFIECRRVWMLTSQTVRKGKLNKAKYDEWNKLSDKIAATNRRIPVKKVNIIEPARIQLANNVNTSEVTAWKDGVFVFNAEKLSTLAVILERKYDVPIKIESEELKDHKFTGTFHKETLEQIFSIINMSAPIKYQIEKGIVTVQMDKQRSTVFKDISKN